MGVLVFIHASAFFVPPLTLAGLLLAFCLRASLCLAAELSRQTKGLAGWLKSPGTTRGLTALLEAAQDSWEDGKHSFSILQHSSRRDLWGQNLTHPSNCPPPQVGRLQIEVVNSQTSAVLVRSLKAQTFKNPPRMQTSSQRLSKRGRVQLYKHEQALSAEPTLVCHHRNLPLSPPTNSHFHLFQHKTHKNTALLPLNTHTQFNTATHATY